MTGESAAADYSLVKLSAQVAVLNEIVSKQAATLLTMDLKMDQLWDASQRERGQRESERESFIRWRWILTTVISILAAVLSYRIYTHP